MITRPHEHVENESEYKFIQNTHTNARSANEKNVLHKQPQGGSATFQYDYKNIAASDVIKTEVACMRRNNAYFSTSDAITTDVAGMSRNKAH